MSLQTFTDNASSDSIRISLSPSDEERELFFYPLNVGYLSTRPPFHLDHSYFTSTGYLVILTTNGTGMMHYLDMDYKLEKNSVAIIPCNTGFHFSVSDSDYRWRFLYLQYDGKQAIEYYNYIMKNKEPVGTLENSETIKALIWQIINRNKMAHQEPFSGLNTSSNIIGIMTEIAEIDTIIPYYNLACPTYLKDVFSYLDINYKKRITLDTLETQFSISKYYLARQFKEYSGVTINEYIMLRRIRRAKFLLMHTEYTISDISDEVGFYDASHFIHQFKKREFTSPHAYRKGVKL